jgi:hypothetical protein
MRRRPPFGGLQPPLACLAWRVHRRPDRSQTGRREVPGADAGSPASIRRGRTGAARLRLLALCAVLVVPCARADPEPEFGVTLLHDTNVTRAQRHEDIRADAALEALAALEWYGVSERDDVMEAVVGVRGRRYVRFDGLSSAAVEGRLAWRRKLGLGLTATWVAASIAAAHEDFRDDTRDSRTLRVTLLAGRRWSAAFDAAVGYVYDRRYARQRDTLVPGISGAVWDVRGQRVLARAGYAVSPQWYADVEYSVRRGDVVSTTRQNYAIFVASDAIAGSGSFGPGFFDYRLRGTTHALAATLSRALGDESSLDFGWSFASTRAAQGLDYRNHLLSATWSLRY